MITRTAALARPNTCTGSKGTAMAWPGPSSGRSTRAVNVRDVMTRVSARRPAVVERRRGRVASWSSGAHGPAAPTWCSAEVVPWVAGAGGNGRASPGSMGDPQVVAVRIGHPEVLQPPGPPHDVLLDRPAGVPDAIPLGVQVVHLEHDLHSDRW